MSGEASRRGRKLALDTGSSQLCLDTISRLDFFEEFPVPQSIQTPAIYVSSTHAANPGKHTADPLRTDVHAGYSISDPNRHRML